MIHQHGFNALDIFFWLSACFLTLTALWYLIAVMKLIERGKSWPLSRIFCFLSGIIMLLISASPIFNAYGHETFTGHMMQHLITGMVAPVVIMVSAPVTLSLKAAPKSIKQKMIKVLKSYPALFFSNPVVALVLNIGGMYLLYLTPLFHFMMHNHLIHIIVHIHFFLAGYLFAWSIAGSDPNPSKPTYFSRLIVLFIGIGLHAYLSKYIYAHSLHLSTMFPADDIHRAAKLMYYGGDITELMLAIIFFRKWYYSREGIFGKNLVLSGS